MIEMLMNAPKNVKDFSIYFLHPKFSLSLPFKLPAKVLGYSL